MSRLVILSGIYLALLALAALSLALAFVPMGAGNAVAAMLIAALKTGLVAAVFMHLGTSAPLLRLTAGIGCVFLVFLFFLTMADLLSRLA